MCFYFDIHNIMHRLSLWRPIFHSEADFQFSLAWIIKEIYPDCEIRLEFVPDFNTNLHLDILVILNGKWIPIELKYTTKKCIKTGCMNWATNTGKGTMRGMEAPIVLTGMYPINWKEYSKVDDTNSGTFMYLVNTISN